jgi:hypothetical protein
VGFATDPQQRWREHRRDAAHKRGYAVHEAIRKHGVENFSFEIICCGKNKLDMLKYVEPELIRQHKSHVTEHGYNLKRELTGANWNSAYGIKDGRFRPKTKEEKKLISEHTKERMSDPEVRHTISEGVRAYYTNGGIAPMKGKHHTVEAKRKMSETTKAMVTDEQREQCRQMSIDQWTDNRQKMLDRLRNMSEETRQKMSVAKKGLPSWNTGKPNTWTAEHRSITYIVTTPNGEELTVTNLSAFARDHNLSQGTLRMTAIGQRQSHKGFKCRFATDIHGKSVSKETKQKLAASVSASWTPKRRQELANQKTNTHLSKETKQKISQATRKFTYTVTLPTGEEQSIVNLKEFCEFHKMDEATARIAMKQNRSTKRGYRFEKVMVNE